MKRRIFLKSAALGSLGIGIGSSFQNPTSHVLTLSFDDGFKKSSYLTADIFEKFGLRACINVIASGHLPSFQPPDDYITNDLLGTFEDWNTLQSRGHEIMPHSWKHANLTRLPIEESTLLIDDCLDYFIKNLDGFKAEDSVYNFAFNASTPELEKYLLAKVRGIRTMGDTAVNKIPDSSKPVKLGCRLFVQPGNSDHWVEQEVNDFLASKGGWLILNAHGLDGEGWGPMSSKYLESLLERLVKMNHLQVLPAAEVLKNYGLY